MTEEPSEPRLPGRTTPTWDMELLVSAASVFTLVQLPGWLDTAYLQVRPRLDVTWDVLLRIFYTYGKLALLILAAAFALHLCMRAYWIALVGMDSIYPDGVRWERLRVGPRRRQFARLHEEPMAARIERADNRASIVFALGIAMALLMVGLVAAISLAYVAVAIPARVFGWDWLLPMGPFALAQVYLAQGAPALGDYALWPGAAEGRADSLLTAHYRDQAPATVSLLPTIDTAFPRGDYLTVLVPFNPRRHPAYLRTLCPRAWSGAADPARRQALLDCFARWQALGVDGHAVPSRPRFTTDARTGQEAVAVVVALHGLGPGEHELQVRAPDSSTLRKGGEPMVYRIVFWR